MYFDISLKSFIITTLNKDWMIDENDKKKLLANLDFDDVEDTASDIEIEVPAESASRIKFELPKASKDIKSNTHEDLLLQAIPKHLRARIESISRGFSSITDVCIEIFVHLGEAGVELLTDVDFLKDQPKIFVIKQELIILKDFFIKFKDSCFDYDVDPIPLIAKLVKSRPGLSMMELIDMTQSEVGEMLKMAYPGRLQKQLAALDWDFHDFSVFLRNWKLINRQESREEGFRYVRKYLESTKTTGKFDRNALN